MTETDNIDFGTIGEQLESDRGTQRARRKIAKARDKIDRYNRLDAERRTGTFVGAIPAALEEPLIKAEKDLRQAQIAAFRRVKPQLEERQRALVDDVERAWVGLNEAQRALGNHEIESNKLAAYGEHLTTHAVTDGDTGLQSWLSRARPAPRPSPLDAATGKERTIRAQIARLLSAREPDSGLHETA